MPKPTTASFLASNAVNQWCKDGDIECYLKKSLRPGELLLINIQNVRRVDNVFKLPPGEFKRTGKFGFYMDMLEQHAVANGFNRITVEGIMNEFLPDVLHDRGYEFVRTDGCTCIFSIQLTKDIPHGTDTYHNPHKEFGRASSPPVPC